MRHALLLCLASSLLLASAAPLPACAARPSLPATVPAVHTPASVHFTADHIVVERELSLKGPCFTSRAPLAFTDHTYAVDAALGLPRHHVRCSRRVHPQVVLVPVRPVFRGYMAKWTGTQWSPDFRYVLSPGYRAITYVPLSDTHR